MDKVLEVVANGIVQFVLELLKEEWKDYGGLKSGAKTEFE